MRTLLYDLEITPMLVWAYEHYDTNVIKVEREANLMCFSYMWDGEMEEPECIALPDWPTIYATYPHNDFYVTKALHDLMDEADIVVAHNAKKFDNRVATARFIHHGLTPPSPYKTVDTLTAARRFFRFGKNSLGYLSERFEWGGKPEATHGRLWRKCISGDMEAWDAMRVYCNDDVLKLSLLYNKLKPYITNHPNVSVEEGYGCPRCGGIRLHSRGTTSTNTGTFRRYQCQDCGSWSRSRLAERDEDNTVVRPELVTVTG